MKKLFNIPNTSGLIKLCKVIQKRKKMSFTIHENILKPSKTPMSQEVLYNTIGNSLHVFPLNSKIWFFLYNKLPYNSTK